MFLFENNIFFFIWRTIGAVQKQDKLLSLKAPPIFAADDIFKFCRFIKNNKSGMIFHENRLLADDSHEISFLISFEN